MARWTFPWMTFRNSLSTAAREIPSLQKAHTPFWAGFFSCLFPLVFWTLPRTHPVPVPEHICAVCPTGSLEVKAKSAARFMGWRTGTCGAPPAAGRKPASDSSTEPGSRLTLAIPASPSTAGDRKTSPSKGSHSRPRESPSWNSGNIIPWWN